MVECALFVKVGILISRCCWQSQCADGCPRMLIYRVAFGHAFHSAPLFSALTPPHAHNAVLVTVCCVCGRGIGRSGGESWTCWPWWTTSPTFHTLCGSCVKWFQTRYIFQSTLGSNVARIGFVEWVIHVFTRRACAHIVHTFVWDVCTCSHVVLFLCCWLVLHSFGDIPFTLTTANSAHIFTVAYI